jgi:hypothetical protein
VLESSGFAVERNSGSRHLMHHPDGRAVSVPVHAGRDTPKGTAAGRDAWVAIPLGATAAQLMGALRGQGNGGLDHSALHMLIETLSGHRPA